MPLDRRALTAALLALGVGPAAAAEPNGLFWRTMAPVKAPCMARHHVPGSRDLIPIGATEPVPIERAV